MCQTEIVLKVTFQMQEVNLENECRDRHEIKNVAQVW